MTRQRRALPQVLLAALLCVASLPFGPPALARTFLVCPSGCDSATIAAALQAADDGDAIQIGAGTYAGGVDVSKDVRIVGAGSDKTTIQGTSAASVIRIRRGANVRITGVTITGGGGSRVGPDLFGGGILNEGQLSLGFSTVRDNAVTGGESLGGGLYSDSSKDLNIAASVISGNRAARGGGIYIREGDALIQETTIANNVADKDGGGINSQGGESLQLRRNAIIRDNRAVIGGGITVGRGELSMIDTTVSGNRASFGGGIRSSDAKLLVALNCTFSGNTGDVQGGGLVVGDAGAAISNCTVEKNQSPLGAGIHTISGDVKLFGSTVSDNIADKDGGGIYDRGAAITLQFSRVVDNRAGQRGGGIFVENENQGSVRVRDQSVVAGNQPDQCFPATLKC